MKAAISDYYGGPEADVAASISHCTKPFFARATWRGTT